MVKKSYPQAIYRFVIQKHGTLYQYIFISKLIHFNYFQVKDKNLKRKMQQNKKRVIFLACRPHFIFIVYDLTIIGPSTTSRYSQTHEYLLYQGGIIWHVSDFLPNVCSLLTEFVSCSLIVGLKGMLSIRVFQQEVKQQQQLHFLEALSKARKSGKFSRLTCGRVG